MGIKDEWLTFLFLAACCGSLSDNLYRNNIGIASPRRVQVPRKTQINIWRTRSSPTLPFLHAGSFYVCECMPISCVQSSGLAGSDWLIALPNVARTYVHAVIFQVTAQVVSSLWCVLYITHSLSTLNSLCMSAYERVCVCSYVCGWSLTTRGIPSIKFVTHINS